MKVFQTAKPNGNLDAVNAANERIMLRVAHTKCVLASLLVFFLEGDIDVALI